MLKLLFVYESIIDRIYPRDVHNLGVPHWSLSTKLVTWEVGWLWRKKWNNSRKRSACESLRWSGLLFWILIKLWIKGKFLLQVECWTCTQSRCKYMDTVQEEKFYYGYYEHLKMRLIVSIRGFRYLHNVANARVAHHIERERERMGRWLIGW